MYLCLPTYIAYLERSNPLGLTENLIPTGRYQYVPFLGTKSKKGQTKNRIKTTGWLLQISFESY